MTNSLCVCLFLPLLLIPLSTTLAKEITTTTFVILGATEHNAQKQHLALNLGIPFDKYKATTSATFTVYHASGNPVESIASFDENFVKSVENAETNRTIVISSVSTSEMSLYELNLLHEILDAVVGGVAVVEFGKESPQTTSVARNSAFCWARTRFDLLTLNRVFLCNGIDFDDIRPMISKNSLVPDSPEFVENPAQSRSLFPCFFASATHAEKKTPSEAAQKKTRKSRKTIQPHGHRKLQLLRHQKRFGKKIDKFLQRQVRFEEMTTKEKKIACRYRKSCYKTGQLPQLDFYSAKLESAVAGGKLVEEDDEDVAERSDESLIDADEISDLEVKLLCKYRPSCYSEIGFDMSEANEKKSASLLSGRGGHAAAPGQKIKKRRTLKEVAQIALRKVEEQEKHSAQREVPKSVIVEKKLSEIEEKLKKKIACRYRKSCYTSGIVPDVEVPGLGFFSGLGASASVKIFGKKEERKEFDEMEDDERKVYCKYRRSCYSTGLLPEIKIEDRFQYDHIIEMDEVPMQVRCKYRKSCYDTGVVPEPVETTEKREREAAEKMLKKKTMPMTLDHLRLMCKYRKSCYVEKAGELEDGDEEKDVVSKNEESPEVPRPVKLEPEPVRKSKKAAKEAPERKEQPQKEKQLMSKKAAKKEAEVRKEEPKKTKPPKKTPPPEEQIAEEVVVQTVKKAMRGKKATHEEKEEEPARKQKKVQKKAEPESGEEEDERKSSCRYRKSCYESGVLPDAETEYTLLGGVQGFFSELYARAMDEGSDDEDDDRLVNSERWMEKSLEERKVDCRYRKSCYESGILPELERQTFDNVIESIRESRGTIQQRCKYRKSCYANEAENEEPVKESPKTKPKPKTVEPVIRREETTKESATPCKGKHCAKHHQKMQEQKKVKEEDNDSEEEEEEKVKPKTRKPRKEVDDDEENMKEIPRPAVDRRNVSTSEKLQCKYRPSCYGSGQFIVITPGGKRVQLPQGHKCKSRSSAYYLSCRQLLGLPPKEKAPIGPSGRKLCRKKKVTDAY